MDTIKNTRIVSYIIKWFNSTPVVEIKEDIKPVVEKKENKMYKFVRLFNEEEGFMSDLYTDEMINDIKKTTSCRKTIAFEIWKRLPVQAKKDMFQ